MDEIVKCDHSEQPELSEWFYLTREKLRMKWCELREYKWNEYVTIAVNRNLSNCEKARKKESTLDPYTGGWPIYWVHQPVKGMKHRMKWCELREYKWNEYVTIAVNRNLSNCQALTQRPWVRIPLKPRNPFFRAFSQLLKLWFTAMVTYSFHLWKTIWQLGPVQTWCPCPGTVLGH